MSAPIERLISRLDGVQQRGDGRWMARCPGHDDKRPSLSVQASSDGTTLIHCFAGCEPLAILGAIGLELADLFPNRIEPSRGRRKPFFTAREVLDALDHESTVLMVMAGDLIAGKSIGEDDMQRVITARHRISRMREIVR